MHLPSPALLLLLLLRSLPVAIPSPHHRLRSLCKYTIYSLQASSVLLHESMAAERGCEDDQSHASFA